MDNYTNIIETLDRIIIKLDDMDSKIDKIIEVVKSLKSDSKK